MCLFQYLIRSRIFGSCIFSQINPLEGARLALRADRMASHNAAASCNTRINRGVKCRRNVRLKAQTRVSSAGPKPVTHSREIDTASGNNCKAITV